MKSSKLFITILGILAALMALATYTGTTSSYFLDNETSSNDALNIKWGLLVLEDGFEDTPWDANWDENGDSGWQQTSSPTHSGSWAAGSNYNNKGYLTTDEIDASASSGITVSFWFYTKAIETGDAIVELYDGTGYDSWLDLRSYPTYNNQAWCLVSEVITDPQYFLAGFRIRFDSSPLGSNEICVIDDVYITTDTNPPAAPTGLAATAGDTEIDLDWDDNAEGDLDGYNVYRSLTSGSGYTKVNTGPVAVSSYTDTGLSNGTTYYYVVSAVDYGSNESGYSGEASAAPADIAPDAPLNLAATAGDRQVGLDWDDNTDYDLSGYNVYRSETSGSGYARLNGSLVTGSSYTDTGLTPGTTYYYVVTAVDLTAHESGYSNEAGATPVDSPPAAPTGLAATAGDMQVSLDWNDNTEGDLDGYNIYRSLNSGSGYTKVNAGPVATSNYTDTGLSGNTYYYVVTAVDAAANESGYSNEAGATSNDEPPATPQNLAAAAGDRQVSLDWDDNAEDDLDGYNVYRGSLSGGPYTKVNGSPVASSDYTDTGLGGGSVYYYVVTAVDLGAQESGPSNEVGAVPYDNAPAAPQNLAATAGDRLVSLDWDDNTESDLSGYNIYRSLTSGTGYAKVNGSPVASSNYTDSGLTPGTTYYYVVMALDAAAQESGYSSEDSAVPVDGTPAAPAGLTATPGGEEISLDWDDNAESDLSGYNIYRSLTSGSGYTKVNGSLVGTSAYTDTGLSNGTTYYYVVTAVDAAAQESGYSNEASAAPDDSAPAVPTGLTTTAGDRQVSLDWGDNSESDLDGYNVYRSETSGSGYTKVNGSLVTSSNYTDTSLTGGEIYYYVVTAVDTAANESGYSAEDSATPTDAAPSAPTGLAATAGNGQVSLDWDDNTEDDLDGYNIYRSETSGSGYAKINGSLLAGSDYTDTGLTNGVTYYYVVTAVDAAANESGYSAETGATPTDAAPSAPTGLAATAGDRQASLDWNDNSEGDLDGYNVYRSETSGSGYSKINSSLLTSSDYTDTGLTGGVTYYYVVTALDTGANESGYSAEAGVTPADAAPAAPVNLRAIPGDGQVSLDWDDSVEDDLDGYNVYRSLTSGSGYSKINGSLLADSDYTDTGLTNGTTYYYVVTAVDAAANESNNSNETAATPTAASQILLDDGFEGTPWDGYWDGNSSTSWVTNTTYYHNGTYSALSGEPQAGYLTSDDLDASSAESITIEFWFGSQSIDVGDAIVEIYNGSTWDTLYDLRNYPSYVDLEWCYFSETLTDPQYAISDFKIRFNSTAIGSSEYVLIDDVLIRKAGDTAPAAPTGLAATAGDRQVSLDWNDNAEGDLDGYNVYRSLTSGGPYTRLNGSPLAVSAYTDTGLNPGTAYCYVVTAVDTSSYESGYSTEASATPTDVAPATPTGLAATAGDLQVGMDWDDNSESDLDGYNIYRSETSGSGYTKINGSVLTGSSYTDTGLTGGVTYYYVVTAVDAGANESGYSSEANATPTDNAPAAPTGLAATVGDGEISLDWNDNAEGDLDGYNVYRSETSGSGYTKINGSLLTSSDYTDTGLTNGVTYYYVVTAVDAAANESGYSGETGATPGNAPPANPTGLLATFGDRQVSLDWNDNSEGDLDGYNVYRSETSGSGYSKINSSLLTSSDYTDTGLTGGVTYYYVVTAVDTGANESGYSNEAGATPTDAAPAVPTGLSATAGDGEVSLDWNDNSETDLDGYNVYRAETSGGPYTQVNGSLLTGSDYTDTGLTGGATYYYVVTAVDTGANESGYSDEANATPIDNAPAVPTGLAATGGDTEIALDWNDNSEADLDGYNIYRAETSGGPYTQVNGSLLTGSDYTDTGLTNGTTYYYVVTAVDLGANESSYSGEANATPAGIPLTLMDDGFEGSPWDANWDGNGTTTWTQSSSLQYSGTSSAYSGPSEAGYLTSDDMDASLADSITIEFWFNPKGLDAGDATVEIYNGSAWVLLYDLSSYPTYSNKQWCLFSETITDAQYAVANFRIRFDSSSVGGGEYIVIDDVLIRTNQ